MFVFLVKVDNFFFIFEISIIIKLDRSLTGGHHDSENFLLLVS